MRINYALDDGDFLNSLSSFDLEMVEKVKKLYLNWLDKHKFSENRFEELRAFMRETLQNPKNLEIFKRLD